MLLTELLHPGILEALAGAGHGARVLLADGHYPASTVIGERTRTVHLNLGRFEFYDAARSPDLAPAIVTADTRTYANLLLTIGVRAEGTLTTR